MSDSEIGELLAELMAIGSAVHTPAVADLPAPLSPIEVDLIKELNAIASGDRAADPVPKIVARAGQLEMDFPQACKADGVVLLDQGQCAFPPPSPTSKSPHPAHQAEVGEQPNDQRTTNAIPTPSPSPTRQTNRTVQPLTRRPASSSLGKHPATRRPRKAAARVSEVATKKTWEGTKSLGVTDRLTNAEKFALGVSHAASVGGVAVSLNLGIGREGTLLDQKDPKRHMMKTLNKHLGDAGFRHLPYSLLFEIAPTDEGGRLHIHGAIDTSGLSKEDIDRLHMALRRAGGFAEGSLGGERQVDLTPIGDAEGWADYCLKATSRVERELDIDDPYMINHPMKNLAKQHFEQLQDDLHDLRHAHKALRPQRQRDAKKPANHLPVFTICSPRGIVTRSGERDKRHVGGAAQRAPRRQQTRTPQPARSRKTSAQTVTPRKRGTA